MLNKIQTIFFIIGMLSIFGIVGVLEDCGGHCIVPIDWKMLGICLTTALISFIIAIQIEINKE